MTTLDNMLTVNEVARRLGRSIEQVRRYLREGKLLGKRIGNQWFIEESALQEFIRRSDHPGERWQLFERINQRREEIRKRWERQGIQVDPVRLIHEIREEEL